MRLGASRVLVTSHLGDIAHVGDRGHRGALCRCDVQGHSQRGVRRGDVAREMSRAERVALAADVERLNEELMRECVRMPVRARSCSR